MTMVNSTKIPRIVIAGTHSGCGKTTTAAALMAALRARGLVVQPFKAGPDFIDPSHHSIVCKRESRNLDVYMMGEDNVRRTFVNASKGADIAVIEGVMGLYDGVDGSDVSSTAEIARILGAPIILVVDVKGMSRSAAALIKGYTEFDRSLKFAGVIMTKGGSERHKKMAFSDVKTRILGWIPRCDELNVESRHLGLLMGNEDSKMKNAAEIIEDNCFVDEIIEAANDVLEINSVSELPTKDSDNVNIAVAFDDAFCFYYRDNFDYLREAGADLTFFSPMSDNLPKADAYYFGGGYPELHAEKLESSACIKALKKAADDGCPVYGECGGLMWLGRSVVLSNGKNYKMAGLLDSDSFMQKHFAALDYCIGDVCGNSFFEKGFIFRGHEFHYSKTDADRDAVFDFNLKRGKGICNGKDGIVSGTVLAGYTHMYLGAFGSRNFVDGVCRRQ